MGATLYTFGLKRGVGVDTLSEFFVPLHLQSHLGCSPTALRGVSQVLEKTIMETARTWAKEGTTTGEAREILGAVDETFLEHMLLVMMDLPSGYLLVEEVAAARTYATWKAVVDKRLKALGTTVLYLVSDRANALIQLAETGFECLSMPDFFPLVHEIVQSDSLWSCCLVLGDANAILGSGLDCKPCPALRGYPVFLHWAIWFQMSIIEQNPRFFLIYLYFGKYSFKS